LLLKNITKLFCPFGTKLSINKFRPQDAQISLILAYNFVNTAKLLDSAALLTLLSRVLRLC
jgi:hypothetical protein